jgi:8-oxo-dGTP pyrophosphatase MutT (NUDIX family)
MREIKRDIVAGVIISKDNKILFGKGREGSVYQDTWLIPGGGVEEGETKLQTLVRETIEEAGLNISNYEAELVENEAYGESEKTLRDTGEKVLVHMHFFTYRVYIPELSESIEIQAGDDLVELTWAPIEKLSEYKLSPPSETLFRKLGYLS